MYGHRRVFYPVYYFSNYYVLLYFLLGWEEPQSSWAKFLDYQLQTTICNWFRVVKSCPSLKRKFALQWKFSSKEEHTQSSTALVTREKTAWAFIWSCYSSRDLSDHGVPLFKTYRWISLPFSLPLAPDPGRRSSTDFMNLVHPSPPIQSNNTSPVHVWFWILKF